MTESTGIETLDQMDAEVAAEIGDGRLPGVERRIKEEAYIKYGPDLRALVLQYREERDALLEAAKAAQGELGRLLDRAADWDAAAVSAMTGVLETQVEDILNAVTDAIANVEGNDEH